MQVAKELLKSQQKNLLETGVAVINVLSNSNDALEGVNLTSVVNSGSTLGNGIAMFSNVSASKTRLNSGSHVDSKGFSGVIGVAKGINEIMNLGAFVELGGGDYDSFNDFNIKGNGKIKYAGIGAIAQFDFANDAYLKANLKVGRVSSDYKGSLQGKNLEYDIDRTYFGVGAGILGGKVFELNEALNLDAYAGLSYSSIGSKSVKIWNETVQFDKINSIKSKVGARLSYNLNESFAMFGGIAHEYEFDGKAKGRIVGKDEIKAPSLKGGTGIGEIGAKMSSGGFASELLLKGLTGKKEGVNLGVNIKYEF